MKHFQKRFYGRIGRVLASGSIGSHMKLRLFNVLISAREAERKLGCCLLALPVYTISYCT